MRENVGSAKNPLQKRRRNAQQKRHNGPCWCISISGAKELILKLGGFTFSFAEITDVMSLESGFRGAESVSKTQFTPCRGKIKPFFRLFWRFYEMEGERDALRHASLGGGSAASVASLKLGNSFVYREARTAELFD